MCTYDYTPYRGCARGQQHFYLQWMKCNIALENGNRHCPLHESIEVEELKKLSGNVLFCPLDNPIAVQQHEFLFIAGEEEDAPQAKPRFTQESRARSRSARSTRGRPATMYKLDHSSENSVGERVRKTSRKKIPRDLSPPPTPDSDRSDSPIPRPRTASGVKRLDDEKVLEDRRAKARTRSHRRASSVEFAPLPIMKVTRPAPSDVTRPRSCHGEEDTIPDANDKSHLPPQAVPPGPLSPGTRARLGLPASPDMHRRNSLIQRSRSESPMKAEFQFPPGADGPATDPEFGHPLYPQPDSSPEQQPEPFAVQPVVRRARTTRSRAATEERIMRRIEEDKRAEEEFTTRLMPTPKREVKMTLPDHPMHQEYSADQGIGLGLAQAREEGSGRPITRAKSEARIARSKSPADLKLDVVPLPQRRKKYVRDESPNLGAIASKVVAAPEPPPPVAENNAPFSYVNKSIRSSRPAPDSDDHHDETATAIFHQKREARKSRRYEEQVAEAKKWALARDQHFSSSVPSLPTASSANDKNLFPHQSPPEPAWLGPRQSNDSGYLSGQLHHSGGKLQRRNTLHKPQPSTGTAASVALSEGSTFDMDVRNLQSQSQGQRVQRQQVQLPAAMKREVVHITVGPTQGEDPSGTIPGAGQGKASLLKRMGLKRKISSLWERNGAAAVAG
ncbi:hypothetical protein V8F20_006050 [Naviculisporaceae sp. PSN 640]